MGPSKVVKPIKPGVAVDFDDEELLTLPSNVVREYRAYESIQIQKFNGKWWLAREIIDQTYFKERLEYLLPTTNKTTEVLEKGLNAVEARYKKQLSEHENKKARDWEPVLKNLKTHKSVAFGQFMSAVRTQTIIEQDFRIPMPGRWISFPLWNTEDAHAHTDKINGEPLKITWTAANNKFEATYYKTTCWFGTLEYEQVPDVDAASGPPQSSDGAAAAAEPDGSSQVQKWKASVRLIPFGETELFIAAEFIEQRYQGAPHLQGLHLRDNFPIGAKWAYMRIDHTFHYGQNYAEPTYRYLIYHPFVRSREIPQRSFATNVIVSTAKSIAASASASSNDQLSVGGIATEAVIDLMTNFLSHPIRRFDLLKDEQALYSVSHEIAKREEKWNSQDRDFKSHLNLGSDGLKLNKDAGSLIGAFQNSVQLKVDAEKKFDKGDEDKGDEKLVEADESFEDVLNLAPIDEEPLLVLPPRPDWRRRRPQNFRIRGSEPAQKDQPVAVAMNALQRLQNGTRKIIAAKRDANAGTKPPGP